MDAIFKALSDPTRRALLDTLRDRGGQTLTELEQSLGRSGQAMTRFGAMKHLKVLEEAKLVITRREGRFKYHYLNALPIQEVADRWMAPYAKNLARFALDIKNSLEGDQTMAGKPDFILETYIKTTQDALWEALTNPERTALYYFGTRLNSNLEVGGPFQYLQPDGGVMLDGKVVEISPKTKIVSTFIAAWAGNNEATHVTFELTPVGENVKFTITHHDVARAPGGVADGWAQIASSLKSLLETGKPLVFPPQQM